MSNKNLDKTLESVISLIDSSLQKNVTLLSEKEEEKILKEEGVSSLLNQKTKIDQKIEDLRKQLKEIDDQIYSRKGNFQDRVPEDLLLLGCSSYSPSRVEVAAFHRVAKSKEGKNYLCFQLIVNSIRNMYNLAVSAKEKRNLILSFQNRNWRELGVDLPPINPIDDLEISNGELIIPNDPCLSESSQSKS